MTNIQSLADAALAGKHLSDAQIRFVIDLEDGRLPELAEQARRIARERFRNRVSVCAIINARSGHCSQDCAFCAQSAARAAEFDAHPLISTQTAVRAALAMQRLGAGRFAPVTSGKALEGKDFDALCAMAQELSSIPGLKIDASLGLADTPKLVRLKQCGLAGYHHNLETSRRFYPEICTTRSFDDNVRTVRDAIAAGLMVCSGALFGLGETWDDRVDLALTLRGLNVRSVPVNFLHPIPGTPLANRPVLSRREALKIVALYRLLLPEAHLRICGGRTTVFGETDKMAPMTAGASGLMIGDYLTLKGPDAASDIRGLEELGFTINAAGTHG
ncbi:MAG: biotin synthase BioB [Desulfovibrionaceae bacterium]